MAMSSRVAAPALRQLGLRFSSTPAIGSARASPVWMAQMRNASTKASASSVAGDELDKKGPAASGSDGSRKDDKGFAGYWGVSTAKIMKPDGTEWKWACFKPGDTYSSNLSIDLKKHHVPTTWGDKLAQWTVKALRLPTDLFFKKRYGCRAMMLETVAAVPGMVGGMLLHCKSLRRFEHSGGWIRALLEEAENERMHLMTFMEVSQPKWYERTLVIAVQGVFFNVYFLAYLISPKLAHRMVGYLEEEAIYSYTEFLKELDKGNIENCPAPAIAIDYWRLPPNATLRDVVMVVRADEAHHRDVNHFASIKDMVLKISGGNRQCKGASSSAPYRSKSVIHHRRYLDGNTSDGGQYTYLPSASSSSTPAWDFTSTGHNSDSESRQRHQWIPGIGLPPEEEDVVLEDNGEPKEWMAQVEPGVHITFVSLPGGAGNDLKRIRFSREMFNKWQAQRWWGENYDRIMELYNVQRFSTQALPTPPRSEDGEAHIGLQRNSSYPRVGSTRDSPNITLVCRGTHRTHRSRSQVWQSLESSREHRSTGFSSRCAV
ncbi:hypothetical protein J5N97_008236 [Dioscorea zingiberensis]|uniref:Ubiquinol oxidase n=1 Tax=Dioscorea zingiberensis TaxID=325984 RepID=A0A9D5HUE3_9LILI|nr:hypothetical protein J5N97_008236 [Dioscorea zingiberensis]